MSLALNTNTWDTEGSTLVVFAGRHAAHQEPKNLGERASHI